MADLAKVSAWGEEPRQPVALGNVFSLSRTCPRCSAAGLGASVNVLWEMLRVEQTFANCALYFNGRDKEDGSIADI